MERFFISQINMPSGKINQSRKTEYKGGERDGDGDGQFGYRRRIRQDQCIKVERGMGKSADRGRPINQEVR
jgi:hypothetical protein